VAGAEGRQAGEACREGRFAAGFFGEDDLVEEADGGICGGVALTFVDEFVECWEGGLVDGMCGG
jgi:hypothetical protein